MQMWMKWIQTHKISIRCLLSVGVIAQQLYHSKRLCLFAQKSMEIVSSYSFVYICSNRRNKNRMHFGWHVLHRSRFPRFGRHKCECVVCLFLSIILRTANNRQRAIFSRTRTQQTQTHVDTIGLIVRSYVVCDRQWWRCGHCCRATTAALCMCRVSLHVRCAHSNQFAWSSVNNDLSQCFILNNVFLLHLFLTRIWSIASVTAACEPSQTAGISIVASSMWIDCNYTFPDHIHPHENATFHKMY